MYIVNKTITLLRHAKSDWADAQLDDHDRPLNARGRRAAPLVGRYLEEQSIPCDVIVASTALRVQQTLELIISTWQRRIPEVYSSQNLYLASPQTIVAEISKLSDDWQAVLVVGHNPGLGDLTSIWAGKSLDFPTACLASFEVDARNWADLLLEKAPIIQKKHYCRPRELE